MTTEVEREILKASGFKKKVKDFDDRAEYLAALTRAVDKMEDDDFNDLSQEASDWANAALEAVRDGEEVEDFEEPEAEEEAEPEEKPAKKGGKRAAREEEDEKPAKKRSSRDDDDEKPAKRSSRDKDDEKPKRKSPRDYENAKRDRFGLVVGSKVSDAVKLFEKGASMKTVKDKTGGPQNNVLKKLSRDGHLVEKYDGVIKVTHKDDLTSKQKSKITRERNKPEAADDDEKPAKKRSSRDDDGDDEKPAKKTSRRDDDDEKPAKSSKRSSRDDDDDDRKSSKRRSRDDDDDRKPAKRSRRDDD